tara:strand:+ start:118960 stop:119592 length:633 start_codon:yes stop_codon:yes gene_type:complete
MSQITNEVVGVILAGGLARRMNHQDKSLLTLADKPLIDHVIGRFAPQCNTVLINSNKLSDQLQSYGFPVIKDTLEGFPGPLAGILAAMEWSAIHQPGTKWIASIAVDTPFLPKNLVAELLRSVHDDESQLACAYSAERSHPVNALWSMDLMAALRLALEDEGLRKIDTWTARYSLSRTSFNFKTVDPFFNINSHDDLIQAEGIMKSLSLS